MAKDLPQNPRLTKQISDATIKNVIDGIVELVTNSDDSYRKLEKKGGKINGKIEIYVNRKKGGICEKLIVKDYAQGMTKEELEAAIEFAGETSGFLKGESVRGFLGRGLKETIIAMGEGEIKTIKDGILSRTKIWCDSKTKKPKYDDDLLNNPVFTNEPNGTEVAINITNQKFTIPEFDTFKTQLSRHYALRDIFASEHRQVQLTFESIVSNKKRIYPITFCYPEGKKVLSKLIQIDGPQDVIKLDIYESPIPLEYQRYNPYGLAGIMIKTRSATLDNQLFKFDSDPCGVYFFGSAVCDGIEDRLRNGEEAIIDFNRAGIEWRHEYCEKIRIAIENELEPLIFEKRKQFSKGKEKEVNVSTQKLLGKLCNLLNRLAKQELEDLDVEIDEPADELSCLQITPKYANLPKDIPRNFRIYAPISLVNINGKTARIKSDNPFAIQPLSTLVELEPYPNAPKDPLKIYFQNFKVVGRTDSATGTITVSLGQEQAIANVKVAPLGKRGKREKRMIRKGGFIADIKPDDSGYRVKEERTVYDRDTGIIWINVNFPSVKKYLRSGFEGIESDDTGKMLLAELVGDAFCRALARRKLEIDKPPKGAEIDAYNAEINKLQQKTLHSIQEIVFSWKFK